MLSAKTFLQLVGTIFGVIGAVHLLRLISGWEVVIDGWMVPLWISFVGVVAAWYFSYNAFMLAKKKGKK